MSILSFSDRDSEELFSTGKCRRFANIKATAERKLQMLDAAVTLDFLRSPPGNRLEALQGDRAGQHSNRINDQWRVCYVWTDKGPERVEICDYH
jgi:proteic killer suppression protein